MPEGYLAPLAAAALVVSVVGLLLAVVAYVRVRRLSARIRPPDAGDEGLSGILGEQIARLDSLAAEASEQRDRLESLELRIERAVQRIGVVRFNPFEDTGSNQSFALALLDKQDNGVVISSLHSRQGTRIYLKAIEAGRSETALSDEESEALRRARTRARERG